MNAVTIPLPTHVPKRQYSDLHLYQHRVMCHIVQHERAMCWVDMGLGKTIISLSAISWLIQQHAITAALVIAPLRVAQQVWPVEVREWAHTQWMRVSLVHGKPDTRVRAITRPAEIYVVNYDGLQAFSQLLHERFISKGRPLPFQMAVFDEVTRFKSARIVHGSVRAAAFRPLLQYIPRRVGLTGTPGDYMGLFGQYLMLDDGQALGTTVEAYKERWFHENQYTRRITVRKEAVNPILTRVAPITIQLNARDYIDMPDVVVNDIWLDLPPKLRAQYKQLEDELFLYLDEPGVEITAVSMAAKSIKCRQFCNGRIYWAKDDKAYAKVHDLKYDVMDEIIEEADGNPMLVAYAFRPEIAGFMERYNRQGARRPTVVHYSAKLSHREAARVERDWNRREIPVLLGHPQSIGHGLNLQKVCHTAAWFGLPWSPDQYHQFIARIARQGQAHKSVVVHRVLFRQTLDVVLAQNLEVKTEDEARMRRLLDTYRKTCTN